METLITITAFVLLASIAEASHVIGNVSGYTRRDGTYVPDYYRSRPDSKFAGVGNGKAYDRDPDRTKARRARRA
jgi:hypothetical protein